MPVRITVSESARRSWPPNAAARPPPAGRSFPAGPDAPAGGPARRPGRRSCGSRRARSRRAPAPARTPSCLPGRGSANWADSRSASSRVNIGGMCCTITMGTGKSAGSRRKISARAFGPPVEAPMASTSTAPVATAAVLRAVGPAVDWRGRRAAAGPALAVRAQGLDLRDQLLPDDLQRSVQAPLRSRAW